MGYSQLQIPLGILVLGIITSTIVSFAEKTINCMKFFKNGNNLQHSSFKTKVQNKPSQKIQDELLLKLKRHLNKMDLNDQIKQVNKFLKMNKHDEVKNNDIENKKLYAGEFIVQVVREAGKLKVNGDELKTNAMKRPLKKDKR